ncbi:hypothetical protein JJL45_06315 [Tamlana sp. s12]|uniref:arsenate reductase family protein n=1 Tax=Tamlana sp. s12 TaxID=1630406 RepID=UPI0008012ADC|nr:hypothetical protein [Tamlana sp. s12]OBQ55893.1 hypothetical protein VQ01_05750 [Tamlana sp. s12]QQY83603.1 hypothetical protein JJL45_06315 [Tamlana sp. s12]
MKNMSILARDKNQLTYIYSSKSHLGKQVLGYIQGIDKKFEAIDISNEKIGDTIWIELCEQLNMPFKKLLSIEDDNFGDSENFHAEDWLKILNNKPELLQKPIAVLGKEVKQIQHRSDILTFFGVDSAGLEKKQSGETPTTSSTTEDERFI